MRSFAVTRVLALFSSLLALTLPPLAWATPSFNSTVPWNAVVTYQSIGLYWKPTNGTGQKASVRFREQGGAWRDGHDLWYDARNPAEYRGSLVELKSGTVYEIELKLGTGPWTDTTASCDTASANECRIPVTSTCPKNSTGCTRTWDEGYRIKGNPVPVHSMSTQLVITVGGSETEGYVVYEGVNGDNTIAPADGSDFCVKVDAKFVVVRNLVLDGCKSNAIQLYSVHRPSDGTRRAASDVIIEDNEIRNWGREDPANPGKANNRDAAVFCDNFWETANGNDDNNRVHRIVVQRNNIHTPRYPATPWKTVASQGQLHPAGAQAVSFGRCGRNHVMRYNDVYSTADPNTGVINHFNDAFGGGDNFGEDSGSGGFPWADSDVYGNRISHVYDDAIESEGDNRNVRIWANYMDRVNQAVGNAATAKGPLYVWRNVSNRMANMYCTGCDTDTEQRHGFIKGGGHPDSTYNGGIAYYYHNSLLQPPPPTGKSVPMGGAEGLVTVDTLEHLYNFVSRNNVWHISKTSGTLGSIHGDCDVKPCTPPTPDSGPAVDYDLYNGPLVKVGPNPEPHGIGRTNLDKLAGNAQMVPKYLGGASYPQAGNVPADPAWSGDFTLEPGSLGADNAGVAIPNFNDLTGRDVGAQPNTGRMRFGRAAATASPPSGAQPPLFDDFEDGDFTGWTPAGVQNWAVVPGASSKVFRQSDTTGGARASLDASSNFTDQMIEADVTLESTNGVDRWAGLFVRQTDFNNTYYITLRSSNVLSLRKLVNGASTVLGDFPMTVTLGATYRLRLEAVGQTLKVYVNGTQVLSATDTTWASGRAAVGTFMAVANFDNILVTQTPLNAAGWLQDNFKDGDSAGWTQIGASPWTVIASNGNNVLNQSDTTGGNRAIRAETLWRDQSIEADVRITGVDPSGFGWAGLFVRFTDENNTYYVTLRAGDNQLVLKKIAAGVAANLVAPIAFQVSMNTTYKIRLEVTGTALKVYVDGALLLQGTDTTFAFGRAGVGNFKASTQFDSIVMSARAPTLISDDFQDGDANGWTPGGVQSWSVVTDGTLVYQQSNGTDGAFSTFPGSSPNQAIQARVKPLSFNAPDNWVGLAARYADFNNHYYITARSPSNELHLKKTVGGTFTTLQSVPFNIVIGAWYKFRLEVLDTPQGATELRVYVDNNDGTGWKLMIDYTDNTPLTTGNSFGLRMFGATAEYDDVVVATP